MLYERGNKRRRRVRPTVLVLIAQMVQFRDSDIAWLSCRAGERRVPLSFACILATFIFRLT